MNATDPITVVFEVRDSKGVTFYLAFQTMTLNAGDQVEIGASWKADQGGELILRTIIFVKMNDPPIDGNFGVSELAFRVNRE